MNLPWITLNFLLQLWRDGLPLLSNSYAYSPISASSSERHKACISLKSTLNLENTTITDASYFPGDFKVPPYGPYDGTANTQAPLCRVRFFINTTDTSSVHAEAWLPDEWYGRFLGIGNDGLGGDIHRDWLDYGSSLHFAAVGSNNGHDGWEGLPFLGHPEVINDFAFRSIHVEAVIGKQIVKAYYGKPHNKAYYLGCSTGGRQGTQEALKFPNDFDGILAGAPATDWNHLLYWIGMLARHIGAPAPNSSSAYIPPRLWKIVAEEILSQCDGIDGVLDGIITEPDACDFRPETLLCRGDSACLTVPQVDALRKIYSPLYRNGTLLYPRYDPGAEGSPANVETFNGEFPNLVEDWLKYAVLNVTEFASSEYGLKHSILMDEINPGGISTFDGNLSSFRQSGGKFLTYHGRMDPIIASGNSKRVYDLVSRTLGMASLDDFYRLFLVPGMGHCSGGPGASNFGQLGHDTNAVNSSSHHLLLALVDWVEGGLAPENITGTAADGSERVHCRYPKKSFWNGSSFACSV